MSTTWITKDELLSKRGDLSQFLIHLTRSGILKLDKDLYSLPKDDTRRISAKKCLEDIIFSKRIEARSAFGYFNYTVPYKRGDGTTKNANSLVRRDWLRAACFTETPLEHIPLLTQKVYGRNQQFENYGLAFKEKVIRNRQGNPVFYTDTRNSALRAAYDSIVTTAAASQFKSFMPLVEGFGAPWFQKFGAPSEIDFRWEREWRVCGDFSFSASDIAFGICPSSEISEFENLLSGLVPFVDPTSSLSAIKQKLKSFSHLSNLK